MDEGLANEREKESNYYADLYGNKRGKWGNSSILVLLLYVSSIAVDSKCSRAVAYSIDELIDYRETSAAAESTNVLTARGCPAKYGKPFLYSKTSL